MTDTSQTPASWLPSLEAIKSLKWMQLAKYGAVMVAVYLGWMLWQQSAVIGKWLEPAPVVASDVTKADLKKLEARMEFFASKAAVEEVAQRLLALEAAQATKRPARK